MLHKNVINCRFFAIAYWVDVSGDCEKILVMCFGKKSRPVFSEPEVGSIWKLSFKFALQFYVITFRVVKCH